MGFKFKVSWGAGSYPGEAGRVALDADHLGDGLVLLLGVVDVLALHGGVVLEVGRHVAAHVESAFPRSQRNVAGSLPEDTLALHAGDVARVLYSAQCELGRYLRGMIFWGALWPWKASTSSTCLTWPVYPGIWPLFCSNI